ncbi:hypothetical protein GCM10011357_25360 [Lacimicrobium alkaliphilum]|uniref:Secreted protein n=1 Tax=Lacimicrobium alkaliphilum TaxID=1526571 RepID=A0ABQ1RK77_9ALTE|nr:hypothetical protein GCM10011357_25360 [Lacimicrobium alkaliphilum]
MNIADLLVLAFSTGPGTLFSLSLQSKTDNFNHEGREEHEDGSRKTSSNLRVFAPQRDQTKKQGDLAKMRGDRE